MKKRVLPTQIGNLARYMIGHQDQGCQLLLASGSMRRRDGQSIVATELRNRVTQYRLPYDRYFAYMQNLESFSLDFFFCGSDYGQAVSEILDQAPQSKMIIYQPHTESRYALREKRQQEQNILASMGTLVSNDQDIAIVARGERLLRVLLLVDPVGRQAKKAWLGRRDNNGQLAINADRAALDAVIAINMGIEGFDWVHADTVVILGVRNSITTLNQILGRPLRDTPGKRQARFITVIPSKARDSTQENLNDFGKGLLANMLLEDILQPVLFQDLDCRPTKHDNNQDDSEQPRTIADMIPAEYLEQVVRKAQSLAIDSTGYKEFCTGMMEFLHDIPLKVSGEIVANKLWAMLCKEQILDLGLDVANLHIDVIRQLDPTSVIRSATNGYSGFVGRDIWPAMREQIRRAAKYMSFQHAQEHCRIIDIHNQEEYEQIARAEAALGRPLICRTEVERVLAGQQVPDNTEGSILPIHPDNTYDDWPGWEYFLGKGPKQVVLVAKPRRKVLLYWVLREVYHTDTPDKVMLSAKKEDLEADGAIRLERYDAFRRRQDATRAAQARIANMQGMQHPPPRKSPAMRGKYTAQGMLHGQTGTYWHVAPSARDYGLDTDSVVFQPDDSLHLYPCASTAIINVEGQ